MVPDVPPLNATSGMVRLRTTLGIVLQFRFAQKDPMCRYGVAVGLAAGTGVLDCSGLGLGLLTGDSFGVGDE